MRGPLCAFTAKLRFSELQEAVMIFHIVSDSLQRILWVLSNAVLSVKETCNEHTCEQVCLYHSSIIILGAEETVSTWPVYELIFALSAPLCPAQHLAQGLC